MIQSNVAGRPVVLLVENEPVLLIDLQDFIEEAGWVAITTNSPADALRLLEAHPEICVVVADLDVRGAQMGIKFAALIRHRWPPVELILIGSWRPAEALPARGRFFDKPFEHRSFVHQLQQYARPAVPSIPLCDHEGSAF